MNRKEVPSRVAALPVQNPGSLGRGRVFSSKRQFWLSWATCNQARWFRRRTTTCDRTPQHFVSSFARATGGVTAIEFAFILPVFLLLLFGIVCYGGYFWMAHDVQQVANDAARSALGGLDATERRAIAERSVAEHIADGGSLEAERTAVRVAERGESITVTVSYDASGSAFWQTASSLFPMPSTTIARSASVTLGGY